MRSLTILLLFVWCPSALAMTPPLSPEELAASSSVIVDGQVTAVECMGVPNPGSNRAIVTPLRALLEVAVIEKQPVGNQPWADLRVGDSIELYFDKIDYGDEPGPGCAWTPSYREGQSGRWWLRSDDDDRLTLVSWNGFDASPENSPLDLPVCHGTDGGPEPQPDTGHAGHDVGGEEVPDSGVPGANDGGIEGLPDAGGPTDELEANQDKIEANGCSCNGLGIDFSAGLLAVFIGLRRSHSHRSEMPENGFLTSREPDPNP
ncbi:MAG: hypothetical protein VX405_06125 [Myxococcota bacterium]|nr:hypothetical protein [Myxococcota bacterium]